MLKAWMNVWKNIFNYKGTVSRKEYWLANIMNYITIYIFLIPCALILKMIPISEEIAVIALGVLGAVYLLSEVSLY